MKIKYIWNKPCKKRQGNGRMYFVCVFRVMLKYRGVKIIFIDALSLWILIRASLTQDMRERMGFRRAVFSLVQDGFDDTDIADKFIHGLRSVFPFGSYFKNGLYSLIILALFCPGNISIPAHCDKTCL